MKKSQLAINSVSNLPHPLEPVLDAYATVGFKNVEFCLQHVWDYLKEGHSPAEAREALTGRGLSCIGGFEDIVECFTPKRQRTKNHKQVLRNAELISSLGGNSIVVGTDGPSKALKPEVLISEMGAVFAEIGDMIKHTGVTVCIEFNWSPVVKSFRTAAAIVRQARRKNVGVLFDPAHYHCTPTKFEQLTAKNIKTIKHVHVDDMRDIPGELSDCNDDRALPGKGCLDLKALFGAIESHGYKGYFSIEMFDQKLWAMPPKKAARMMYASLEKLCTSRK